MKNWIFLVLFLVLGSLLRAEEEGEWEGIEAADLPAEWAEFRERIESRQWVLAEFVEERYFPFRFRPVELKGTVWYGREEGLTLNYREPREEVVRVEETGVRVIEEGEGGRSRTIPERGGEIPAALLSMFRLDFSELEKTFALRGRRDGESWALRLTPHDRGETPIDRIEVAGTNDEVNRIVIEQTKRRRIELTLSEIVYPSNLDEKERARVFP